MVIVPPFYCHMFYFDDMSGAIQSVFECERSLANTSFWTNQRHTIDMINDKDWR